MNQENSRGETPARILRPENVQAELARADCRIDEIPMETHALGERRFCDPDKWVLFTKLCDCAEDGERRVTLDLLPGHLSGRRKWLDEEQNEKNEFHILVSGLLVGVV